MSSKHQTQTLTQVSFPTAFAQFSTETLESKTFSTTQQPLEQIQNSTESGLTSGDTYLLAFGLPTLAVVLTFLVLYKGKRTY
jgi:hypothetical protein